MKPIKAGWNTAIDYIKATSAVQDIVISGGDSYLLHPEQLKFIGESLLNIDHVRRFRFATKGIAVTPSRILDQNDKWTDALIHISNIGRKMGKHVSVLTNFNHPNEFSWVTREAAQKLFANGVTVRNQSVLLRGVNDSVRTMSALIGELADNNIQPVNLQFHLFHCPSSNILSITSIKVTWSKVSNTFAHLSPPSSTSRPNYAAVSPDL